MDFFFFPLFGALWLLSFGLALREVTKFSFGDAPKTSTYFSAAELNSNKVIYQKLLEQPEFLTLALTTYQ